MLTSTYNGALHAYRQHGAAPTMPGMHTARRRNVVAQVAVVGGGGIGGRGGGDGGREGCDGRESG